MPERLRLGGDGVLGEMMNTIRQFGAVLLGWALLGMAALPATATTTTHTPPPAHHASSWHHGGGSGWHGYHHGYGFYGHWPWYFPWAYGYGLPFYGTTFYEGQVTYVEMAPAGAVQPANVWYYCKDPEGYFPYVKTCPSGWQTVPMQPAPALPTPPGAQPAPVTPPGSPPAPATPAASAVPPPPPPAK